MPVVAMGQGSEDFSALNAPLSFYYNSSFTGASGLTWTYAGLRSVDETDNIEGRSVGFGRDTIAVRYLETRTNANGLGSLSFRLRSYFSSGTAEERAVRVLLDGTAVGTFNLSAMGRVETFTLPHLNRLGEVTLRIEAVGVYQVVLDDVSWTAAPAAKPSPSGYPTAVQVVSTGLTTAEVSWQAPGSGVAPDGYVVFLAEGVDESDRPADGSEIQDDLSFAVGLGIRRVLAPAALAEVGNLKPDTVYYVRVFPFTNFGVQTDYLNQPLLEPVVFRTPKIFFQANTVTGGNLSQHPAAAPNGVWSFNGRAVASAFLSQQSTAPGVVSWLYTPPLDLGRIRQPAVAFVTRQDVGDAGLSALQTLQFFRLPEELTDPEQALGTWMSFDRPSTPGPQEVASGTLVLPTSGNVRLGFRYASSGRDADSASQWTISDWVVFGYEPPPFLSLSVSPVPLLEGQTATLTVTASQPATSARTIQVSADLPGRLSFPAQVFLPAGDTTLTLSLQALEDTQDLPDTQISLSATSPGLDAGFLSLTVVDNDGPPALHLSPATATLAEGATGVFTVALSRPADTEVQATLKVVPGAALADLPRSLIFSPGVTTASVTLAVPMDMLNQGDRSAQLEVTAPGYGTAQASLTLLDLPLRVRLATLDGETASLEEGETLPLLLSLEPPPPAPVYVRLRVSPAEVLAFPESVLVGATPVLVEGTAVEDGLQDGTQEVEVRATANQYLETSLAVTVLDADAPQPDIELTSPAPGAVFTEGRPVRLAARLWDVVGGAEVVFRSQGYELKRLKAAPFAFDWQPSSVGRFTVTAELWVDEVLIASDQQMLIIQIAPEPPALVWEAPSAEAELTYFHTVELQAATASGATVTFYRAAADDPLDEEGDLIGTAPGPEARILWTAGPLGVSRLTAVATDADGQSSAPVTRQVTVTARPSVSWVQPSADADLILGESLTLQVQAIPLLAEIQEVHFHLNGVLTSVTDDAPYTYLWTPEQVGSFTLYAEALDTRNPPQVGRSASRTVRVRTRQPLEHPEELVEQLYLDFLGRLPSESEAAAYPVTDSPAEALTAFLNLPAMAQWQDLLALGYLLTGAYPDPLTFHSASIGFSNGTKSTVVVGWAGFLEAPQLAALGWPEGEMGLSAWLLGGVPATLPDRDLFALWWQRLYGEFPTAQQTVQALSRLSTFAESQPASLHALNPSTYARARLALALLHEERINGQPVIHNLAPSGLHQQARAALLWLHLWQEQPRSVSPTGGALPDALQAFADLAVWEQAQRFLWHPRYWQRAAYAWLDAPPSEDSPWRHSPWWGTFTSEADAFPYAWHLSWGACYLRASTGNAVDVWVPGLGWLHAEKASAPWLFSYERRTWLLLHRDGQGHLWTALPGGPAWQQVP